MRMVSIAFQKPRAKPVTIQRLTYIKQSDFQRIFAVPAGMPLAMLARFDFGTFITGVTP